MTRLGEMLKTGSSAYWQSANSYEYNSKCKSLYSLSIEDAASATPTGPKADIDLGSAENSCEAPAGV